MKGVVDLTHHLFDEMAVYPGIPQPAFRDIARVADDGYAMSEYHLINHIGTHIDAPAHQILNGNTLDEIPLERLITDAVTIDVSDLEPGPIDRATLERRTGEVRRGDFVFLYSDNARNYGTDAYWTGWSFPDADAAQMLIDRGISGIGFDGPSCDPVDTTTFDLHCVWLGAGRLILENLTNLGELPARCRVVIAPLKVRDANGGPSRVFAFLPAPTSPKEDE